MPRIDFTEAEIRAAEEKYPGPLDDECEEALQAWSFTPSNRGLEEFFMIAALLALLVIGAFLL